MRVETNTALVQRNRKLAQYLFFFSLLMLSAGFLATNARFLFPEAVPENTLLLAELALPAIILPIAFASTLFSVRMTNLWVRQPRPDAVLPENLKGLGNKAVLYNYYHFPARHVLIAPQGVFAIITRFQNGAYTVEGDKWRTERSAIGRLFSIFRMDSVGNPTQDAIYAAGEIKKKLEAIVPDIDVYPVVVFVDPRVKLTIINPIVPVLHAQTRIQPSFKDYLKSLPRKNTLTPEQIHAFEIATCVSEKMKHIEVE
jgi:hypothetical protein